MITRQIVFNAAWQKFVIEKAPPAVEKCILDGINYACRYLTVDGRKCAIGLCIPDGHPAQHSIKMVNYMSVEFLDLKIANNVNVNFQRILHDNLINLQTGKWIDNLDIEKEYHKIAKLFSLTIPGE